MIEPVALNSGGFMPRVGLGVFALDHEATARVVQSAIELGYRSIDTAAIYGNEAGVAEGIRRSGIPRSDLFLTTKLWNDGHSRQGARQALAASLDRLGTDQVDLYLIHWPNSREGRYLQAWEGLEAMAEEGLARSIGISNFSPPQVIEVIGTGGTVRAVNQIELHPYNNQVESRRLHEHAGIVTEAWSPLARGAVFNDPVLASLAAGYGVTVAQLVLRWHMECGVVAIPKSSSEQRLRENLDVAGISLEPAHVELITALDRGQVVEDSYYLNA